MRGPDMSLPKLYSIWLIPSGDTYSVASKIISALSRRLDAPGFEPHVTLINRLVGRQQDIASKAAALARSIAPFRVRLSTVEYLDHYSKCLFIRAKATEGLVRANSMARDIFGRRGDPAFMPHMSLLYGFFPQKVKESIVKEIGPRLELEFEAERLHLFCITGSPGEWYGVGEFDIRKRDLQPRA